MPLQQDRNFFHHYELDSVRRQSFGQILVAAHQQEALEKLHRQWFKIERSEPSGGILVLPTGGGKTFTAIRFLCSGPLSQGYKVSWLAHTHHLLEQAFYSFNSQVQLISEPKQQLNIRVVSGTLGHFRPHHIKSSDDVVICTLQTATHAYREKHAQLEEFLKAAGSKLFVVFDEAHHSPAPSYCRFITALRERCPKMYLLGLTATPTYTDERRSGWLKKLFPQGILYQVSPSRLMAEGILAKPVFEKPQTHLTPNFNESDYQKWVSSYRDLPEEIITKLAENRERNAFIAKTYASNKEHYGKTIIFADRWFQCEQLRDFLEGLQVRVGTIFAHIDTDPGSADARNRRDKDENARVLEKFRSGELDVLVNIRMLTEGTDVPDVQTVFLTRQTTSKILLTQMVGRALRGPRFRGTEKAHIVSFVDNWQHSVNWAEYDPLEETPTADEPDKLNKRQPIELLSVELVRQLIEQMNNGVNVNSVPFLTLMPIGWYRVKFEALTEGDENTEIVQRLIMVFENEKECYQKFINYLKEAELNVFVEPDVCFDSQRHLLEQWQKIFFNVENYRGENLLLNLFHITRHIAQNDRIFPDWFDFEQREHHNLDTVAQRFISAQLGRREEDERLKEEYNREDCYWRTIYDRYELFKSHYNACVEWLLREVNLDGPKPSGVDRPTPPEPSDKDKRLVKQRDNYRCLCCGAGQMGHRLVVDHINPKYLGGSNLLDNLQTLCCECNKVKGISIIDFRIHQTLLTTSPSQFPKLKTGEDLRERLTRSINFFYCCAAVKSIRVDWGIWEINLHAGNNPCWLIPHLKTIVRKFRQAGLVAPCQIPININTPGFDITTPING